MNINLNWLDGKKSYLLSICGVIYAITGLIMGYLTVNEALMVIGASLGLSTLRSGIEKNK